MLNYMNLLVWPKKIYYSPQLYKCNKSFHIWKDFDSYAMLWWCQYKAMLYTSLQNSLVVFNGVEGWMVIHRLLIRIKPFSEHSSTVELNFSFVSTRWWSHKVTLPLAVYTSISLLFLGVLKQPYRGLVYAYYYRRTTTCNIVEFCNNLNLSM